MDSNLKSRVALTCVVIVTSVVTLALVTALVGVNMMPIPIAHANHIDSPNSKQTICSIVVYVE